MPGQLPAVSAPPRPSPVPDPNIPIDLGGLEDDDDQAETRLFRPKIDVATTTKRERYSSRAPSEDRPSRPSRPTSRPGALIVMPGEIPSVRVRSDSDIELMDTRMSDAGLVPARRRRSNGSLTSNLLIAGVIIAVAMLVAHEIALTLHLAWLDPRTLFGSLR